MNIGNETMTVTVAPGVAVAVPPGQSVVIGTISGIPVAVLGEVSPEAQVAMTVITAIPGRPPTAITVIPSLDPLTPPTTIVTPAVPGDFGFGLSVTAPTTAALGSFGGAHVGENIAQWLGITASQLAAINADAPFGRGGDEPAPDGGAPSDGAPSGVGDAPGPSGGGGSSADSGVGDE